MRTHSAFNVRFGFRDCSAGETNSRRRMLSPADELNWSAKRPIVVSSLQLTARIRANDCSHPCRSLWVKDRIENRISFGSNAEQHALDRSRQLVSFEPGSVFAFVRWASNDSGTIFSRIDILRGVREGERYSTVPGVRPGGETSPWIVSKIACRVPHSLRCEHKVAINLIVVSRHLLMVNGRSERLHFALGCF